MIKPWKGTEEELIVEMNKYFKVGLTGPPKTGKTTLSNHIFIQINYNEVVHGDDFIEGLEWSQQSERITEYVNCLIEANKWDVFVEGVIVPRAVRKGMKLDAIFLLTQPREELTSGQIKMGKGLLTVLQEVVEKNPELPIYAVTLND